MERASIPQHLKPPAANEGSQNMQDVACAVYHALGKVWGLLLCVSRTSTVLSKHEVAVEPLFCLIFWECGFAWANRREGADNWTALNLDFKRLSWVPYSEQATPAHLGLEKKFRTAPLQHI